MNQRLPRFPCLSVGGGASLFFALLALSACTRPPVMASPSSAGKAGVAEAAPPAPGRPPLPPLERVTVLMISGGGSPAENYQSHLGHLRQLSALLIARGVPRERISI